MFPFQNLLNETKMIYFRKEKSKLRSFFFFTVPHILGAIFNTISGILNVDYQNVRDEVRLPLAFVTRDCNVGRREGQRVFYTSGERL